MKTDIVAELRLLPGHGINAKLTTNGRNAIVDWLDEVKTKLEESKCGTYSFDQPSRLFKLKIVK